MTVEETLTPAVVRADGALAKKRLTRTSLRLFLIEDSPVQAEMFEVYFRELGYEVTIANDGLQGLTMLHERLATEKEIPNLLVLDYWLPGQNGVEVCRQIRQERHFNEMPIMIFSGKNVLADKLEAYKAGADFYVVKSESGFKTLELLFRTLYFSYNSSKSKFSSLTAQLNS